MQEFDIKKFQPYYIVAAFFLIIFIFTANISHLDKVQSVRIAGQNIKVELALTQEEQAIGLSKHTYLNADHGMLFIFTKPNKYLFWMKAMNFPIDIIWINENMQVVYIKKDAQPEKFLETYGPNTDAKYVLEVVAGFSDKNNLKEGDSVSLVY